MMTRKTKRLFNKIVSALCISVLTIQPVLAQSIVADGNGPQVIESNNGTTMVMINTPDANGISHNTYTQFDVGTDGAILNNADTNTATTQLGGVIQGNSNLRGGAAGVILNEVTSTNPSLLEGFLEVGGKRADVIIANPNGITCDGCGFINTSRLTMTTGRPTTDNGQFNGFSVDDGLIQIGRGGLDATDTTTFDLLSRQIRVDGVITGQRIRIVAGRNDIIYATSEVTKKEDNGSPKPELAIDSRAVGGMYANAITITSTEEGVGVQAPQDMAANAGGMVITADGRLVMQNTRASESISVQTTGTVEVTGDVSAGQDVSITSAEDLVLAANARLVAESATVLNLDGDLNVQSNAELAATRFDLDIAGAFQIGRGADVTSVETVSADVESLTNNGTFASTEGRLLVTTSLDLTNQGLMFGDTSIVLSSNNTIQNNGGSIIANGDISIGGDGNAMANTFTNRFGAVVETISGDISIAAVSFGNLRDEPDRAAGVELGANPGNDTCDRDTCYDDIREDEAITHDHAPSRIISAGDITIAAGNVVNAFSTITAFGDINITADSLTNVGQNYYRDNGNGLTFIGADFGVIEAGGNISAPNISGYVINGAVSALASDREGPSNTDLTAVSVTSIGNPDLIFVNRDPDATFLVETRPEFVDLGEFISSDYFLGAIAYDPELKRFGDAYTELLLIRKQLQQLLGQLILTTGITERAQIEAMYNNAINELEKLDLTPGIALAPDQIGALTSDIIWLEETVIDGQRVLAPKVYLANPEIRLAGLSGAMITGENVNIQTGNFDNAGNIRATDTISIAVSDTFRSAGGTISAEDIAIVGNDIMISTDARTVRGSGVVKLPIFRSTVTNDRVDDALQTARFVAGRTIVLTARDTIVTSGAQITAGDNIALLAGGDITIGALTLTSAKGDGRGSNRNRVERLDHMTTRISADGDIVLLSSGDSAGQNDIVLEGANLTAGGNVGLIAQDGDLVLAAVTDMYRHDYARKSGNFLRKKVRERLTVNFTHQVASVEGATITGVADNNILVEGSRFEVPGIPDSELPAGQLSLVSVNGSSLFTAPTNIYANSSFKSTAFLGGLITNSKSKQSLLTASLGTLANAAGDIALNSGGDLTLTSVDFNAGGEFVTTVTGTTYLLAAIDVEHYSLVEHRDNGVIMSDIRKEDLTENVTFSAIEAAGGVNFDTNSQIILAGSRNPLIDSAMPGVWAAKNDSGRLNIETALAENQADESAVREDKDTDSHWREGGKWSEEGTFMVKRVALPTGADAAKYAYLDGVLDRDSTINDPIELVSYSFYERKQALSPAFKALVTIALTQGMAAGLETAQFAQTLQAANFSSSTANAITVGTASFGASVVVEGADGVVSGDFDIGEVLGAAGRAGLTAGVTAGINAETFGADFEGLDWANTSPFEVMGFGEKLTIAGLTQAGIDASLSAGLTIAFDDDLDGADFLDLFQASMRTSTVNLTMADLQVGIGDLRLGEGSFEHAALHGLVGCAAAEALDGDCASGAAAGIAQSLYAGLQDGRPERADFDSENAYDTADRAWRHDIAGQAQLLGAAVGYATSSGKSQNVSNAGGIAKSGIVNNYLSHAEAASLENAREQLERCDASDDCSASEVARLRTTVSYLEELDEKRDADLRAACTDDPVGLACKALVTDALIAVEYYRDPTTGIGYPVMPGYALLERYLANGMDGHPREGFVEDVYQHREDAISLLNEFRPSVELTQQELANGNGAAVLAALTGGGVVVLGARVATACVVNPTCRASYASFEVAGSLTDLTACANGDGVACGAVLVPVATTGGLGDELAESASTLRHGDDVTVRTGRLFDNPSQVVQSRVDELTEQIPENSRGRITMGVAVVEDAAGNRQILVSTSEQNGYLRPGVSLNEGEVLVRGPRGSHAEADIVRHAEENGLTIVDIGATRPVCHGCQDVIPDGTNVSTPLK